MQRSVQTIITNADDEGEHRKETFARIQDQFMKPNLKMADLGAGSCIFAKIAQSKGHKVTAFDARTVRKPSDEELGDIEFVQADVRFVDLRDFDVVAMLGLIYHFYIEDQLLVLRRAQEVGQLVMDTQVHIPDYTRPINERAAWEEEIVQEGEYEGVRYPEEDNPMAAVGNDFSFWHTPESLMRMFENVRFNKVIAIEPVFRSKYGARQFFVLE